jgi:hypothetical protein
MGNTMLLVDMCSRELWMMQPTMLAPDERVAPAEHTLRSSMAERRLQLTSKRGTCKATYSSEMVGQQPCTEPWLAHLQA